MGTFVEVVEFAVETGEVSEVGGGCFDEERGVPVGLDVGWLGKSGLLHELVRDVDDHYVLLILLSKGRILTKMQCNRSLLSWLVSKN